MINNKLNAFNLLISFVYMLNLLAYHYIDIIHGYEVILKFREGFECTNLLIIYFIWLCYGIISVKTEWVYKNFYSARNINYAFLALSFISIGFDIWSFSYFEVDRTSFPTSTTVTYNWIIFYLILALLLITNTVHLIKSIKTKGFIYTK